MMLVQWHDQWLLAQRATPESVGCSLSGGNRPELARFGFTEWTTQANDGPIWRNWRLRAQSTDGITFYPEVRYWGMKVYPESWDPSSTEPILVCRMMGDEILRKLKTLPGIHAARERAERSGRPEDREAWVAKLNECNAASDALRRQLVDDGWLDTPGEGFVKHVHVDELEKFEGPPPEGAF